MAGSLSSLDILPAMNGEDSYGASLIFCEVSSVGSWAECLTALLVSPKALLPGYPPVGLLDEGESIPC
jgi:hypothetical protein